MGSSYPAGAGVVHEFIEGLGFTAVHPNLRSGINIDLYR